MIRLVLSILIPVVFLLNYWYCEWAYPGSSEDWSIFIPMDETCHNFWAAALFLHAISNCFKITRHITYYFIYLSACLSFFDINARLFSMVNYNQRWYVMSLVLSFLLAGIFYAAKRKSDN